MCSRSLSLRFWSPLRRYSQACRALGSPLHLCLLCKCRHTLALRASSPAGIARTPSHSCQTQWRRRRTIGTSQHLQSPSTSCLLSLLVRARHHQRLPAVMAEPHQSELDCRFYFSLTVVIARAMNCRDSGQEGMASPENHPPHACSSLLLSLPLQCCIIIPITQAVYFNLSIIRQLRTIIN